MQHETPNALAGDPQAARNVCHEGGTSGMMSGKVFLLLYAKYFHHVAAYTPSYYTRHISILSCLRVYTLLLYAAHIHLVMSPRIHPHIIRGRFPSCHVAAYTPSYYTRHISTLTCCRVYTLLLYAAPCHPVMSPRMHPLIIRGTFPP